MKPSWSIFDRKKLLKIRPEPTGLDSDMNPVGFRQHANPAYQGLRHIPGHGPYPLQDSFYARGFGTGTRHRGAAVVMQVTTNANYTPPTIQT